MVGIHDIVRRRSQGHAYENKAMYLRKPLANSCEKKVKRESPKNISIWKCEIQRNNEIESSSMSMRNK